MLFRRKCTDMFIYYCFRLVQSAEKRSFLCFFRFFLPVFQAQKEQFESDLAKARSDLQEAHHAQAEKEQRLMEASSDAWGMGHGWRIP